MLPFIGDNVSVSKRNNTRENMPDEKECAKENGDLGDLKRGNRLMED